MTAHRTHPRFSLLALCWCAIVIVSGVLRADDPPSSAHRMELPADVRGWYTNPDGSCVQCSIGMCGMNQAGASWLGKTPWSAALLLWKSQYGPAVRGGSSPSRVEAYCDARGIAAFNVTGASTWDWMRWAARTGRMAAIGAGGAHFQTLYGWDEQTDTWFVANNNSTWKVDTYSWSRFRQLHLASGQWVVILDVPPPPVCPRYVKWW